MEPALRRQELMQVKSGGGSGSYAPTREKLPDIVNRQSGTFSSSRAPWSVVQEDIKRLSKSDKEEAMNLTAAKAIHDHCVVENIHARELDGFPLTFSMGLRLVCWSPALFIYDERMTVPFFDMRRKYFLTPEGVRFMFSVMHIALRENNPDYEGVSFEIKRLTDSPARTIRTIAENGMQLFSYEALEEMVAQTQQLWLEVQQERQQQQRRDNDDWDDDSLFGTG